MRQLVFWFCVPCIGIFAGCLFVGMDFVDSKLRIANQSKDSLGILLNIDYPDTSINNTQDFLIYPGDTGGVDLLNSYWDDLFKKTPKVTLYFVDWRLVEENGGKNKVTYPVLKQLILSKRELDSLNWTVHFP